MARILGVATVLVLLALGQKAVLACGDKFFLVGRGDRFQRAYASLHPGTVLIYTGGTTEVSKGLRDVRLHKYIDRAGHRVLVAADHAELKKALESEGIDVVLAGLGQADDLVPEVGATGSKPTLLPIEGKGPDAPGVSKHQFAASLKSGDNVNRYLARIEDVMKSRRPAARSGKA
jgi:hypothetical protein